MQISQLSSNLNSPALSSETQPRVAVTEAVKPSAPVELPAKAVQQAKGAVNADSLRHATEKINQTIRMMNSNLQFTVDQDTGMDVVKVVDTESKVVIRQFPSEEVLAIAKALDQLQGLLIREKA